MTKNKISLSTVTLMFGLATGGALADDKQPLNTTPQAYVMSSIEDEAFGKEVVAGNYHQAIASLSNVSLGLGSRFAIKSNLCVSYVMTGDADNAQAACDAAVQFASRGTAAPNYRFHEATRRDKAIALSNRGVMYAITGQTDAAMRDFDAAASAGWTQASRNRERLAAKTSARVAAR